jgi:hypothetical protein
MPDEHGGILPIFNPTAKDLRYNKDSTPEAEAAVLIAPPHKN